MRDAPTWSWPSPYGGYLVFSRVCPDCGQFVKADETLTYSESFEGIYTFQNNATCKLHGRVLMPFIGDI